MIIYHQLAMQEYHLNKNIFKVWIALYFFILNPIFAPPLKQDVHILKGNSTYYKDNLTTTHAFKRFGEVFYCRADIDIAVPAFININCPQRGEENAGAGQARGYGHGPRHNRACAGQAR